MKLRFDILCWKKSTRLGDLLTGPSGVRDPRLQNHGLDPRVVSYRPTPSQVLGHGAPQHKHHDTLWE